MARPSKKLKGIRRKGKRWEVYVDTQRERVRTSFPLDTPIQTMQAWQESKRKLPLPAGCLAEDVLTYLQMVRHMPTYHERKYHLELWARALGPHRSRHTVTTIEINHVLSAWRQSGKAIREGKDRSVVGWGPLSNVAVRHRRTALLHFYKRMDPDAPNPVQASWRPADPAVEPRALDPAVFRRIWRALPEGKTKARLRVMATTGLPHKQLGQITAESIDWEHSRVFIPARQKGAGARGRWLPLTKHGRFALRALARVDGFGPFSASGMHSMWTRTTDSLNLPRSRPYDVRHMVGTQLYAATGDLATVARLLGHANQKMAQRYSLSAHELIDAGAMARVRLPRR